MVVVATGIGLCVWVLGYGDAGVACVDVVIVIVIVIDRSGCVWLGGIGEG